MCPSNPSILAAQVVLPPSTSTGQASTSALDSSSPIFVAQMVSSPSNSTDRVPTVSNSPILVAQAITSVWDLDVVVGRAQFLRADQHPITIAYLRHLQRRALPGMTTHPVPETAEVTACVVCRHCVQITVGQLPHDHVHECKLGCTQNDRVFRMITCTRVQAWMCAKRQGEMDEDGMKSEELAQDKLA
ncbi:hypothetical protein BC940DRAFT_337724 [Gongronella butleri]|nr:hypothetical protein BC940DRAFT_337724 [Gongronella butleri]